jgi:hypothetical protein
LRQQSERHRRLHDLHHGVVKWPGSIRPAMSKSSSASGAGGPGLARSVSRAGCQARLG